MIHIYIYCLICILVIAVDRGLVADTHNMHAEINVENGEVMSQSGFMTLRNPGQGLLEEWLLPLWTYALLCTTPCT